MIKGQILFDINRNVILDELDERVRANRRWTRWENSPLNTGYSGLSLDTAISGGVDYNRLTIIWTDDGVSGYVKDDLTALQITRIKELING